MTNKNVNGLLISAGYSGRMGQFKPLMLYKNKPFVVTIVEMLLTVCEKVVVVTGFQKEKIESLINSRFSVNVECVFNSSYEFGMFTSLQAGLTELKNSNWILYHFVDQPFLEEKFYSELISQINDSYDWVQPCYNGKDGHPVIFNKNIFEKILTSKSTQSLLEIRDDGFTKIKRWECGNKKILIDFDTPVEVEKFFSDQ